MHLTAKEAKILGIDIPDAKRAAKFSSGKRDDLGGQYFRSLWEANYARYLNWLIQQGVIARWEYEVDEFEFPVKRGCRFYKPDFKVWGPDGDFCYHEVKGWMDGKSATKLKRMARHFPDVKVVLIDRVRYQAIARIASKAVSGWETGVLRKPKNNDEAFARMISLIASSGHDVSQYV